MIEYTLLKKEHIDELCEIEKQCFNSGYAKRTFEKELENKLSVYYVAMLSGKAVGYAGIWNICGEAEVISVAVGKEFRRRGIARGLMKKLIEKCGETGVYAIHLEVREKNAAARALYEGLGFEYDGLRKGYYEGKEDAALMTLKIKKEDRE